LGIAGVGVWLLAAMASVPRGGPVFGPLSQEELEDIRRLKPPPRLAGAPGRQNLALTGDAKALFQQTAKAFGLECVFDADYPPGPTLRLRIEDAAFDEALHQVEAATGSFVAPVS